jgi:hypothetical protein
VLFPFSAGAFPKNWGSERQKKIVVGASGEWQYLPVMGIWLSAKTFVVKEIKIEQTICTMTRQYGRVIKRTGPLIFLPMLNAMHAFCREERK